MRLHLQTIRTQNKTRDNKPASQPTTNLWFHQHKINKQNHEVMFDIFIRKPPAPGALRQSHIPTDPSTNSLLPTASFGSYSASIKRFRSSRTNASFHSFGSDSLRCRRRSREVGPSIAGVAAVRNVVELGDRVAAFNADWHLSPRLTDECTCTKMEELAFELFLFVSHMNIFKSSLASISKELRRALA